LENIYNCKNTSLPFSIKDVDGRKGIVTGYFAAFGNKDSDGDVILKGAFAKSIKEAGPDSPMPRIKHLFNHDVDKPLGKLLILSEDEKGLYYESKIGNHTLGLDFLNMVESGLITEHSIGFRTIRNEKDPKSSINYLKEVQLWEGSSLGSWGANAYTPVMGMKSAVTPEQFRTLVKKQKEVEDYCLYNGFNEETFQSIILYHKQLLNIIENLSDKTTAPREDRTLPGVDEKLSDEELVMLEKMYRSLGISTELLYKYRSNSILS